ncbi:hypothetical protein AD998_20705 [bacterium 336/3]|nr:hypothetical protein AD998_20705 [bacterium 336/3]
MEVLLHYRFRFIDKVKLIKECFDENGVEYREMDNLIFISSTHLRFTEMAVLIYQKLIKASSSKTDYLYLYTVNNEKYWFCIIIKKIGNSRMYNIISRLKSTMK